MATKKQRLFNVYVLTLKKSAKLTKDRQAHKYTIKDWKCFYHVSRELAFHYIDCHDCMVIGYTKDKVDSVEKGFQLFGRSWIGHNGIFTFCVADPVLPHADLGGIDPDHHNIGIRPGNNFNNRVERMMSLIADADTNRSLRYMCQCRDVFVPEQLIPKGWEQVKEGKIQTGDLIWENDKEIYGYWRELHCFEEEKEIEDARMSFVCCDKERTEEVYEYKSPFVIRKKSKK